MATGHQHGGGQGGPGPVAVKDRPYFWDDDGEPLNYLGQVINPICAGFMDVFAGTGAELVLALEVASPEC